MAKRIVLSYMYNIEEEAIWFGRMWQMGE
jgi:hypothetical protein